MKLSLFQCKLLLFGLAVVAMNALLFTTFALGRMSMWIVSHDAINAQMDREGALIEHGIAEMFFSPSGIGGWFFLALIGSVVFLMLLWYILFRAETRHSVGD